MGIFKSLKDQLQQLIDPNTKVITMKTYVNRNTGEKKLFLNNTLKQVMEIELSKALLRQNGKMSVKCYEVNDMYFLHSKVPSTSKFTVEYDVIFKVAKEDNKKLSDRRIQIFSNDPSFIFKYAYVFNQLDLLIDEFKTMLPPECLTKEPAVTNPNEDVSAHKASLLAGIYLLDKVKVDKFNLQQFSIKASLKDVFSKIQTVDSVMNTYHSSKKIKKIKI